jgi:tRNA (cytidine/uridine-2'-O-)-methyltransferase
MDAKKLRRAGLDYHEFAHVHRHKNFQAFLEKIKGQRLFGLSTKGSTSYCDMQFQHGDCLLFGPETRGLPESVRNHESIHALLTIPMAANSRSLNLSNSVAIVKMEAWRQLNFNYE